MAASFSLNTKGALSKVFNTIVSPTARGGLLNPTKLTTNTSVNNQGAFTNPNINIGNVKGVLAPPKATTPLKKTTTTQADGSTVTHEYHPEPQPKTNTSSGMLNKAPAPKPESLPTTATNLQTSIPQTNPNAPAGGYTAPVSPTAGGQIQNVANTGQQTQNEAQKQKAVEEAGAMTQWEQDVKNGMAVEEANKRLSDFRTALASKYAAIEGQTIPLEFQQGREQVLARQAASTEAALQSGVTNALTAQGQQFNAAQTQAARGLTGAQQAYTGAQNQAQRGLTAATSVLGAVSPQFPSYGSQIVQPGLLGTQGGIQGSTLQNAVSNVVQKLQNGEMTYNDATNALSGYGQGGLDELQKQLPQGFNIAQSNTMAGQQGSVKVNYELADKALQNVEAILGQLGGLQTTNVPLINKTANWLSTQFGVGSEETRAMTGAVQSLRNAYASLLASSKGGIPTDYSAQAIAEIPNEPTPNDIAAIRKNFETLGKARADILGNPGQSNTNQEGTVSAGGYNFKKVNGKWVPA